ncbi:MAG: helix-hairpin-helix domain-containing protein [Methylovulum sp.]|uniref:ComEA family DNA-binding protein n=1 Tax=Methylovulum sp. TaxID=1916980 RepID=UPI00261F0DE0|nr:helix-hairpin-helix domain-containing protein [Methylovulum sp.]MDD2724690.1 helix-hairpin-helix domain-containing protein [Methylovulum sp.]MDD5124995.1 helix-hairpin-helix domain-containing protein [Methylovulum sp.]
MNVNQALNQALNHPLVEPSLTLAGNCGYEIQNDQVIITIAEIANNRDADNISGTLAIELWAVAQPYRGGDFNGLALAGNSIGELYGQHFLADCRYEMAFQEPGDGTWYLALMLREWTEVGYITRDYINFDLPYIVGTKPTIVRSDESNIINVSFADNNKPSVKKVSKNAKAAKKPTSVSLNQASLEEIEALKGVSKKLAENIVSERPFESLDEVLKVKGIGSRLLDKIRQFITL